MNLQVLTKEDVGFIREVVDAFISFTDSNGTIHREKVKALQIDEQHVLSIYDTGISIDRFVQTDYGLEIGQGAESVLDIQIECADNIHEKIDIDIIENMTIVELIEYLIRGNSDVTKRA
jgi:hypothetical protein